MTTLRLLVADKLPQEHLDRLHELGHDLVYAPELATEDLPAAIEDREVLVVRSTKVTGAVLGAGEALRLVVRAGSGTDTIDVDAAAARGVIVCNVPGRNALAVAELAFGLLLALDRRIVDQVVDLRDGRWRKRIYQQAPGIAGRHVGVVGLGDIGLAFAERAAAFGCHVHAVARGDRDPRAQTRAERVPVGFVDDLEQLARRCDVLSFHVPAAPSTRGLIGRPLLDHVQPGAILINTARGELIDEDALLAAIDAQDLRVGLDVYPDEPPAGEAAISSRLAQHPNVYGTHHVGASTEQAQRAVAAAVVDTIDAFARGAVRDRVTPAGPTGSETSPGQEHR